MKFWLATLFALLSFLGYFLAPFAVKPACLLFGVLGLVFMLVHRGNDVRRLRLFNGRTVVVALLFLPLLAFGAATPEEIADGIRSTIWDAIQPWLVKFAIVVGAARLLLKPVFEWLRNGSWKDITWQSVLNWLTSINLTPLKVLVATLALPVLLLTSGCASTGGGGGITGEDVAMIAEMAAYDGTALHLAKKPGDRPKFEEALARVTAASTSSNITQADLIAALREVKQLDGPEGSIVVGNALILYNRYGRQVNLDTSRLRPITEAVARGLRNGLDDAPKPKTAPLRSGGLGRWLKPSLFTEPAPAIRSYAAN